MRRTLIAGLLLLGIGSAAAQDWRTGGTITVAVSSLTGLATGMLAYLQNGAGFAPGNTTGAAAQSGAVGEYIAANSLAAGLSATISSGSPAVITATGNTLTSRCTIAVGSPAQCIMPVYFTGLAGTDGGTIVNNVTYFVDPASITGTTTFRLATTIANALAGTDINTSGTDSGTANFGGYLATSGAAQSMVAIYLPAGDWDCGGNITINGVASTAPTSMLGGLSPTVNSINPVDASAFAFSPIFAAGAIGNSLPVGPKRFLFATQTLLHMTPNMAWTGGATNPTAVPFMRCRRMS